MGRLFLARPLHYTSYVIRLKRLNGSQFILNCDLIKTIEETPDTLVTLTSGEKFMVQEPVDEVVGAVTEYRQKLLREPPSRGPDHA
jgi:flagellar protein FlbD